MNTESLNNHEQDFDKVIELLSPRFPRKTEISFKAPKKNFKSRWLTISGIAAMFAIVLTIAIKSVMPVSAAEVINSAITYITNAKSIRVEFAWRGIKSDSKEIYTPDSLGNVVDGTLSILRKNDIVKARIDWHDSEKNSIVFNGRDYIRLRNNKIIDRHSSSFGEELMILFSQNTLPEELINKSILSSDANIIIIESHKREITLRGEFHKDSKRLAKASASVLLSNGQNLKMLETKSIEIDISIPESIFIE